MNHLEEIKSRLSIEELVSQYVQLKKAGRNLRGLCPFHGEKTPSFMVSPEKGIAYCFGCHQGGDIFKFVQLVESISFAEALKLLAQKTNVKLPTNLDRNHDKRSRTLEMNDESKSIYKQALKNHPEYLEYFKKRGLTDESIEQFELGYAPDSFSHLKNQLTQKGFGTKELLEGGISNQRQMGDSNTYDRFRNRLIFPIHDHQGNTVAFSGRIIGEGEPKYLNSPDTPAYNKSTVLYGLHLAKESIKQDNMAIIVEGYMDVITAHQAGTKNIVATCGTALTPQQLKLIQRFTDRIAFAFDQDSAGIEATLRAIELAEPTKLKTFIIKIPNGKDPDECIKEHPEAWQKAVENPMTVMDFYFDYAINQHDPETIEGKKAIADFLLPIIKLHKSQMEQNEYLKRLALALKTDLKILWNDLNRVQTKQIWQHGTAQNNQPTPQKSQRFGAEDLLISFLINFPEWIEEIDSHFRFPERLPEDFKTFYTTLKKVYTLERKIDPDTIKSMLSENEQEKWMVYTLLIDEHYPDFSDDAAKKEVLTLVQNINHRCAHSLRKEVELEIRTTSDQAHKKKLLGKLVQLSIQP